MRATRPPALPPRVAHVVADSRPESGFLLLGDAGSSRAPLRRDWYRVRPNGMSVACRGRAPLLGSGTSPPAPRVPVDPPPPQFRRSGTAPEVIDLSRLHGNDPEYFRLLVDEQGPMIAAVVRRYATDPDDAEDLYQSVWAQAWVKRRSYAGHGHFRGWLRRLATNRCLEEVRVRRRQAHLIHRLAAERRSDVEVWHPVGPSAILRGRARLRTIGHALEQLPARQRTVVELRILRGLSAHEVAGIMGITPATVRSLLRHAFHRLRALILEDPSDGEPRDREAG